MFMYMYIIHVDSKLPHSTDLSRFDADLNACKEDATSEVQAKEQLAREKDRIRTDYEELNTKLKVQINHYHFLHNITQQKHYM